MESVQESSNSNVVAINKKETDRAKMKRDLIIEKLRENFSSTKEIFSKFKCKDLNEVIEKGKNENLSLKDKGKLQRFANTIYIECWKDGRYNNLQLSQTFCEELENVLELKFKKFLCSDKLCSSLASYKNRNGITEKENLKEEFENIKDNMSLTEVLTSILMPDFIQKITKNIELDKIDEFINAVNISKNGLPGQPEETKFGSLLIKLKINATALWKRMPTDDLIAFVFSNEEMCLYAGQTCIVHTKNINEIIHLALCFRVETRYSIEPNLELLLSYFAKKLKICPTKFFKKPKKYSTRCV